MNNAITQTMKNRATTSLLKGLSKQLRQRWHITKKQLIFKNQSL